MATTVACLVALFLAHAVLVNCEDVMVQLDRVRYPVNEEKGKWAFNPAYTQFDTVCDKLAQSIFIGKVWAPPAEQVENLVLLVSGQQNTILEPDKVGGNCVAGSSKTWNVGFGDGVMSVMQTLHPQSLPLMFVQESGGVFTSSNTFLAVVNNANFNYEWFPVEKESIEAGFTHWLLAQATPATVKRIFLVGASRGGALVLRMARRITFSQGWDNTQIYVGSIDAFPNAIQNELDTFHIIYPHCYSPYNDTKFSNRVDLNAYYLLSKVKPQILHICTGDSFYKEPANLVHGMAVCHEPVPKFLVSQTWQDVTHGQLCGCYQTYATDDNYSPYLISIGIQPVFNWILSIAKQ